MKKHLKWILAAVAPVMALGFSAKSANAGTLDIYLQEVGVDATPVLVASATGFTNVSYTNNTYHDFKVQVFSSASDDGASLSDLLSSTTSIQNISGAEHTLLLFATQTDYSLPAGTPVMVESGLGGSVNQGTLGMTGIFQAYFDSANQELGMATTNGPQNGVQTNSTFDTGSAHGLFDRTGLYSLTSVTTFDVSGGGKANYSDHVNVTAVPLPSAAWGGLGLLGVLFAARRRVQA